MPDLDVIVKSLRRCSDMTTCPADCYYRRYAPDCVAKLHKDAINLLKEQNDLLKEQEEQKRKWLKAIADTQLAVSPTGHETAEELAKRTGEWNGLQMAWDILMEGR